MTATITIKIIDPRHPNRQEKNKQEVLKFSCATTRNMLVVYTVQKKNTPEKPTFLLIQRAIVSWKERKTKEPLFDLLSYQSDVAAKL